MALFTCNFRSAALAIHTACHVILPQPGRWDDPPPARRWPTLWLLHGLSDDHTIWLRQTAIERYVTALPLAVVMPAVNRSFYQDMVQGARYWSFVSEELPALARSWFPLSQRREENFVAGLSMGGYGALRLALTYPERFAAVASFSGALEPARTAERHPELVDEMVLMFGDLAKLPGSDSDLFALAERVARSAGPKPPIYQYCGRADVLYDANVRFHKHVEALGLETRWVRDNGGHTWDRWDAQIARALAWLQELELLT